MRTVLVAEDEKLIRKGLMTMVRRAPVEAEEILEACDGKQALAILQQQEVDLVITDIRMPGLDGLELVRNIREMHRPPFIMVISGYDDFSYAVEMLRNGVQDYLLKPVERQSLYSSLEKIEDLVQERNRRNQSEDDTFRLTLRSIMMSEQGDAGTERLIEQNAARFLTGTYCVKAGRATHPDGAAIFLQGERELGIGIFSVPQGTAECAECRQTECSTGSGYPEGISGLHRGLEELPAAYREAVLMWKRSFFTGKPCCFCSASRGEKEPARAAARTGSESVPAASGRLISADQLVRLIGMGKWQDTVQDLRNGAGAVTAGRSTPEEYAAVTEALYDQLCATYRSFLSDQDIAAAYISLWDCRNVQEYLEELENWIEPFSLRIQQEFADYENKQKIRQAVQYMQENFRTALNMAIVSNHVSMNYSLFSLLFKQYTGMNFVTYLQNLRIEEARKLLAQTDWYVNEIGIRCGFQDDKHFLKVFKAAEGVTPTEWRKAEAQKQTQRLQDSNASEDRGAAGHSG